MKAFCVLVINAVRIVINSLVFRALHCYNVCGEDARPILNKHTEEENRMSDAQAIALLESDENLARLVRSLSQSDLDQLIAHALRLYIPQDEAVPAAPAQAD